MPGIWLCVRQDRSGTKQAPPEDERTDRERAKEGGREGGGKGGREGGRKEGREAGGGVSWPRTVDMRRTTLRARIKRVSTIVAPRW